MGIPQSEAKMRSSANSGAALVGQFVRFHALIGALLGVLLLHPLTMAIYWFEFHHEHPTFASIWQFFIYRIYRAFTIEMLLMTLMFAAMGALLGSASGIYSWSIARRDQLLDYLQYELARDIHALIDGREGETVEFKASARWDFQTSKINGLLEQAIVKTIAGFLNHRGGNLLIGVEDSGHLLGLNQDYATLKAPNRDGFAQFIMALVKTRLGGSICPFVHILFQEIDGRDVCRVIVEPASQPVYVRTNGESRYFLRTGNATRELDVKEALQHISQRWPNG